VSGGAARSFIGGTMARPKRRKKSEGFYKNAVRVLRHGFVDTVETDDYQLATEKDMEREGKKPLTRGQAIAFLKDQGYPIGKEVDFNPRTGVLTDVRRTGNLASGFTGADGYDLSEIDQWTPKQKAKVTKLFRTVSRLSARPFQIYRARKPENLRRVQEAAQHHIFPEELNVAFIPVGRPGEKARVRLTEKKYTKEDKLGRELKRTRVQVDISERDVKHTPTLWSDVGLSMQDVADDPVAAVRKVIKEIGGKTFAFLAGPSEFRRTRSAKGMEKEILRVMDQYEEGNEWMRFLFGMQSYDMPEADDLEEFKESKDVARDSQEQFRREAKKIFRRMYGGSKKKRSKSK